MNYPVPNYGPDHDIIGTKASIKTAEDSTGQKWNPKPNADGGYDMPSALQVPQGLMQVRSDPICNSSGCTQYLHPSKDTHPMDYPVPDFGVDHDIISTQNSSANAEKDLDIAWNPESFDKVP